MGMGHVSTSPLLRKSASSHVSRRERRRTRKDRAITLNRRVGALGESLTARWLEEKGLTISHRNVRLGSGEIDLIATDGAHRVVVEVRTVTGSGDPIDAVDIAKRHRVQRLAGLVGADRVDFVGVGVRPWGVDMHWLPG